MFDTPTDVQIKWILLADHADVINGKLYIHGGGWENLTVNQPFPATHPCSVVVAFAVPWTATNRPHKITIEVADEDGQPLLKVDGDIEVGRPAGLPQGKEQLLPMAINTALKFEKPGTYVVTASVQDGPSNRSTFRVVEGPVAVMYRQQAEQAGSE